MAYIKAASNSHAGRMSPINEDCFLSGGFIPDSFSMETGMSSLEYSMSTPARQTSCFAVFAGTGGGMTAKVGAFIAAEELKEEVPRMLLLPVKDIVALIRRYTGRVSEQIETAFRTDKALNGMGTSFACICLRGEKAVAISIGGCRVYQYRVGQMTVLNSGASTANYLGAASITGKITLVTSDEIELRANDRFLVCSPGIVEALDETAIRKCLEIANPEQSARQLVAQALEHGGRNSITGTVIAWQENDLEHGPATDLSQINTPHKKIEHTERELNRELGIEEEKPVVPPAKPFVIWEHFPAWVGYLGLVLGILAVILIWYFAH